VPLSGAVPISFTDDDIARYLTMITDDDIARYRAILDARDQHDSSVPCRRKTGRQSRCD
jgi:hypothetical protein